MTMLSFWMLFFLPTEWPEAQPRYRARCDTGVLIYFEARLIGENSAPPSVESSAGPPGVVGYCGGNIIAYTIAHGNAKAVASALRDKYKSHSKIRVLARGSKTILVYADPEVQVRIGKEIIKLEAKVPD
jgi:hypothetical protein